MIEIGEDILRYKRVFEDKWQKFEICCSNEDVDSLSFRIGNSEAVFSLEDFSKMGKAVLAFFQHRGLA